MRTKTGGSSSKGFKTQVNYTTAHSAEKKASNSEEPNIVNG